MGILSFSHLEWIEQQYNLFRKDPSSLQPELRSFFEGWELGLSLSSLTPSSSQTDLQIYSLINAYRSYGHLAAEINPFFKTPISSVPELSLERWGIDREKEKDQLFPTCGLLSEKAAPLSSILEACQKTYCGPVGIEYKGCVSVELEKWIEKRIEPGFKIPFSKEEKTSILYDLNRAALFENFLHTKYVGQKRFSLEGGETLIPMLAKILEVFSEEGGSEIVLGMSHRGRLNVLANILNKPYATIFQEFEDSYAPILTEGTGDVKYHKGFVGNYTTKKGGDVHVTLSANPSHLESVDPVVLGSARARQQIKGKKGVLPILVHGDAALAGQGVVYEVLQLGGLKGYGTGGVIHLVINNQIGFTTLPKDSRSTPYCTDIAKAFGAPVFHVNAERPEQCVYAALLAAQIRQKFQCDVFLDLVCYRKYGHNEGDEPSFTQPLEYKQIRQKRQIKDLYRDFLVEEKSLDPLVASRLEEGFQESLKEALSQAQQEDKRREPPVKAIDKSLPLTGVSLEILRQFSLELCTLPLEFHVHPKVQKVLQERLKMVEGDPQVASVDWAMAEQLAFASLLTEGIHVRLSGQDSQRGTFSQRHAVLVDQEKEEKVYFPLSHLKEAKASFDVFNSPLSEMAVLGFEFGYSLSFTPSLVIWEAQYGDFANGAQIIIDQYIAASEQKWSLKSNLTLMLPHGYEGQGPEHSSARMERYLQLCGHQNLLVANCTSPSQLFHLLRYQALKKEKTPLILFTPKALLRHPAFLSPLEEFEKGSFKPFLEEGNTTAETLIFCSGKIYYDLVEAREGKNVAILRIEQLYPFSQEECTRLIKKYAKAKNFKWVQEEPKNMGAWEYISPLLQACIGAPLVYVGREESASTAVGSHRVHKIELKKLLQEAFSS